MIEFLTDSGHRVPAYFEGGSIFADLKGKDRLGNLVLCKVPIERYSRGRYCAVGRFGVLRVKCGSRKVSLGGTVNAGFLTEKRVSEAWDCVFYKRPYEYAGKLWKIISISTRPYGNGICGSVELETWKG